ncbi:MAG: protein-L-isoaspartate O-methyltransferase [Rhodothermaceae bacterium]|nr:MAG: protein-L-isoaspartate O-methyltransferase [Rhodothermaceae bacterium]
MDSFAPNADDWQYRRRRARLVEALRVKGIDDERVLAAIERVPRHLFVDPGLASRAYSDEALPIGFGQTISQPFTVAYQTMLLDVRPGDRILEVGTGSGYQAAVLCELGAEVYSIERIRPLLERTRALLKSLGYRVTTRLGDGSLGWPAFAPYDGIIVTAGAREIPEALLQQLRIPDETHRGGRLVIPIGDERGQTMNLIIRRGEDDFERREMDGFRFVPLIREE